VTASATDRSARAAAVKIVAIYWALLVFGMVVYTALRLDAVAVLEPMWAGTIAGTALGQVLAVRRYRTWLAVLLIVAVALFVLPHVPAEVAGKRLWLAFMPAALCGFWSLGDRTTLASFWFPAVIWMLSILDGAHAGSLPNGNGLVLFAALAVLFVVFLRVREERRVALWRTVAPGPLATPRPHVIVKERAGVQVARGAWGLFVTGLGFAATAWLAPSLWTPETHDGKHVAVGAEHPTIGVPCCPAIAKDKPTHTRVKEYFNVGRADVESHVSEPTDCRVCEDGVPALAVRTGGSHPTLEGVRHDDAIGGDGTYTPTTHRDSYQPPATWSGTPPEAWSTPSWQPPAAPTPSVPQETPIATTLPTPAPAPTVHDHDTDTPQPPPAQQPPPAPPQVAYAPPQPPRAHVSSNTSPVVTDNGPSAPVRSDRAGGLQLLHWIAVLVAAMFFVQLLSLVLRPLRRALVLRHLRRPFWTETVDQRVSNAWQLVLVGLRDAGWRADSGEPPREVAKRVHVHAVEDCATILDRARHGIRIDREDLDKMALSADTAYRSARANVGRVARAISWLRWPLV
jgi:hypothetical protein